MYAPHRVAALVDACLLPACHGDRLPGWIAEGLAGDMPGVVLYGQAPAGLRDAYPDALIGRIPSGGTASGPVDGEANLHLGVRPLRGVGATRAYVEGVQAHGVAVALGPFDGEPPLLPFAEGVAAGVRAVTVDTAAALGGACVPELLRGQLGYDGVAVSGPLDASAVVERWGVPGAAVLAWIAGLDLLRLGPGCGPGVHRAVHTAAARAVADGDLPAARLAEAATRVARLRRWAGDPGRIRRPAQFVQP